MDKYTECARISLRVVNLQYEALTLCPVDGAINTVRQPWPTVQIYIVLLEQELSASSYSTELLMISELWNSENWFMFQLHYDFNKIYFCVQWH